MLIEEAPSATAESPVLFEYCSANEAEAAASLQTQGGQARLANTLLMTWYNAADYDPDDGKTDIFGSSGTCDTAGYRVKPNSYWQTHISSIAGAGNCNRVTLNNRALDYAETQPLPTPYVGNALNDNIGLTQVFRR